MELVLAIQHWRHYLLGRKFVVYSDQKSLKHLLHQRITTSNQQEWMTKLPGFNFEGGQLQQEVLQDPVLQRIIEAPKSDPNAKLGFSLKGGRSTLLPHPMAYYNPCLFQFWCGVKSLWISSPTCQKAMGLKAQEQMKLHGDKKRKEAKFEVGDWVFLKLKPHRQQSLKKTVGKYSTSTASLKAEKGDVIPAKILSWRDKFAAGKHAREWLVQWEGTDTGDATWEEEVLLKSQFPDLNLEDKAVFVGGGVMIGSGLGLLKERVMC
ncbi:retrotransposon-related protein [Trifolium pratense]|uniref:Retrotransposon-related protein n=1 Tax=Trifolium pratense TaxID=57577 RepID=A0A2K3P392_TRIPR|nr:retrotransposon-related protein [Trifolium pratense]